MLLSASRSYLSPSLRGSRFVWVVSHFPHLFFHSRATQHACMLLRYLLESKAGKEAVVMKLKSLEASVSTGRKCKYLSLRDSGFCFTVLSLAPWILHHTLKVFMSTLTVTLPGDSKEPEHFARDHSQMLSPVHVWCHTITSSCIDIASGAHRLLIHISSQKVLAMNFGEPYPGPWAFSSLSVED